MYRIALALAALIAFASTPRAQLIALNDDPFTSSAPSVDIGSVPSGTRNPVYTVAGGALGNVTVSFGGYFVGQTLSSSYPINVFGSPVGPLTFEIPSSPFADGNAVRFEGLLHPIISGQPYYIGPISVLFSKPVSAVAFWAHGFFAYQTTTLAAFSLDGTLIGETRNDAPFNPYSNVGNAQWIGFKDPEGKNSISGLTYFANARYSAAMAPAISSFKFGSAVDLVSPHTPPFTPVPEPTTYALGGLVMIFGGIVVRTKRLRAV